MDINLLEKCWSCDGCGINWVKDPENGRCPSCAGIGEQLTDLGDQVVRLLGRPAVRAKLGLPALTEEDQA